MATVIKNIPFAGGTQATFEFDFGTKVAGSTAECPMKIYWSRMSSLQTPSSTIGSADSGWFELGSDGNQSVIDVIKKQDGGMLTLGTTNNGVITQYMVELDLNPLCTALFGGSHSAMVSALSAVIPVVYAKGSGSNNGTAANGVGVSWWNDGSNLPTGWNGANNGWAGDNNTSSSIQAINPTVGCDRAPINSDNKLRILVYALYPSNGTIASEVDLDYINIKLNFNRIPDVIAPIPISLPNTWCALVKNVSPSWLDLSAGHTIFALWNNTNDRAGLCYSPGVGGFSFYKYDGSATHTAILNSSFSYTKWKTINFLICYNNGSLIVYMLINQGTLLKATNPVTLNNYGSLLIGTDGNGTTAQTDGFINSLIFLPNKVISGDAEAETVLRGTAEGFEPDELFDITKVALNTKATLQNGVIILNATAAWQPNDIFIQVLPNNQYTLSFTKTGAGGEAWVDEYYNSIEIKQNLVSALGNNQVDGTYTTTFVTGPRTNRVHIAFDNGQTTSGTYTFSNISLKLKM